MNTIVSSPTVIQEHRGLSNRLTILLATGCGLIAANIYYAQPLIGPISVSLGLSAHAAGLVVTMTQIGYGAGLLLIVPMADIFENRRLVLMMLTLAVLALVTEAMATQATTFLAAAVLLGLGSAAAQVLVPYAAHLAREAVRGRLVGNIMSGLMLGIMFARPVASLITDALSWRAVFIVSALMMVGLAVVLGRALPSRQPAPCLSYGVLLSSMASLARRTPLLQRRALYHACLFGAFSLFWTTVPLLLADTFHLSQSGIALFALAGVAGAIAAPIAGRAADRGWSKPATALAMFAVAAALLLGRLGASGFPVGLAILVLTAILLDFGVTANFVLGQRAIFGLDAEFRGRLNGLYMATFFLGGAACSALGSWTYAQGGWSLSMWFGFSLPAMALVCHLVQWKSNLESRQPTGSPHEARASGPKD